MGINYLFVYILVATDVSVDGSVRRRSSGSSRGIYTNSNNSTHAREPGSMKFTLQEIVKATRNFSPSWKIGQGGFGTVYKGRLQDGTLVAVKRAKKVLMIIISRSSVSGFFFTAWE